MFKKLLAQTVSLKDLDPFADKGFSDIVNSIVGYLTVLAIPVVTLMILIGGFQILTSQGDEEKFKSGKKTIWYAVLGYAAIWASKGIIAIVTDLLGAKTS